eukprot:1646282-Pyramimonas_sp.AAC.1
MLLRVFANFMRCPLFDIAELHTSPSRSLAVDSLHTLYYGPVQRYVASAMWRVISTNPWNCTGTLKARLEIGCRRLSEDMGRWFGGDGSWVPHSQRIGFITLGSLGSRKNVQDLAKHPGGPMSFKAAETGVLLEFALHELQATGGAQKYGSHMMQAGHTLCRYLQLVRDNPCIVSDAACKELMTCMCVHLRCCELVGISLTPKHHLCVHTTDRSLTLNGNAS